MQFAESEGFEHVHVHVVPRLADWPSEFKGPKVFAALDENIENPISLEEMT